MIPCPCNSPHPLRTGQQVEAQWLQHSVEIAATVIMQKSTSILAAGDMQRRRPVRVRRALSVEAIVAVANDPAAERFEARADDLDRVHAGRHFAASRSASTALARFDGNTASMVTPRASASARAVRRRGSGTTPHSIRLTVSREIPAFAASCSCVRPRARRCWASLEGVRFSVLRLPNA
jgi:hypothetical protein